MKKFLTLLLIAILVIAMGACSSSTPATTETATDESVTSDEDIYIINSQYAMLSPFFIASSYGFIQQAEKMGIKASVMDGGNVLQRQIDMIDDAITRGADAIIITPMDSDALSVAVQRCNDAGIPVFTIDRTITGGKVTCVLQSDNVECGRKVAREFLNQFEKKGMTDVKLIQIKGQLGSSPSRDRDKGFWEVIDAQNEIKVTKVAESAADWETGPAQEATLAHLTAHPEANAIFYEADCMAPGVFAAMEQLNRSVPQSDPKHIVNGGVDGSKFALDAVRAGTMDVCISQMPYSQGVVATYMAYHAVKYGGAGDLPPQLLFDTQVVTPDNINDFGDSLWGDLPIGGSELPDDLKKMMLQ